MEAKQTLRDEGWLVIPIESGWINLLDEKEIKRRISEGILAATLKVCNDFFIETGQIPTSCFMSGSNANILKAYLNEKKIGFKKRFEYDESPIIIFHTDQGDFPVNIRSHCGTNAVQCIIRRMEGDTPDIANDDD